MTYFSSERKRKKKALLLFLFVPINSSYPPHRANSSYSAMPQRPG